MDPRAEGELRERIEWVDRFLDANREHGDLAETLGSQACTDEELFGCLNDVIRDIEQPMKLEVIYWLNLIYRVMDGAFVSEIALEILSALNQARLIKHVGNQSVRNLVITAARFGHALYAFQGDNMYRVKAKYFVAAFGLGVVRRFWPGLSQRLKLASFRRDGRITIDDAA